MDDRRWKEVELSGKGLTPEELAEGWHFCEEWDYMLIGPGMSEVACCHCDIPALEQIKREEDDRLRKAWDEWPEEPIGF